MTGEPAMTLVNRKCQIQHPASAPTVPTTAPSAYTRAHSLTEGSHCTVWIDDVWRKIYSTAPAANLTLDVQILSAAATQACLSIKLRLCHEGEQTERIAI